MSLNRGKIDFSFNRESRERRYDRCLMLVFVFPDLRNVRGTCSQLFSLATGQYGMRPVSPVWWWKVCPSVLSCECSPGPRQGQCLDPSIQSPPYTSPHHHQVIYTFFSRLFPTQLQLSSCLIEMTVPVPVEMWRSAPVCAWWRAPAVLCVGTGSSSAIRLFR